MNTTYSSQPLRSMLFQRIALCIALLLSPTWVSVSWAAAPFTVNLDGTVTDSNTSLVWDQCTYGLTGSTCSGGTALQGNWSAALAAVVSGNSASYKGFADWRLPNKNELVSLVKTGTFTYGVPAIDTGAFPATLPNWFWTSTTYAPSPNDAWAVNFGVDGQASANSKSGTGQPPYYVRLVRSGQSFASYDALNVPPVTEFPVSAAPYGITTGPDGNLWFTELYANRIGKMSTTGAVIAEYPVPTLNAQPYHITTGPDGNLWFTEFNGNKIGKITTTGDVTEYLVPTPNASLDSITAGPDGNLWFTEQGGNKIGKITTTGTITEYAIASGSPLPGGIAAGPDGNLWFAERVGNRIGKITTAGVMTEYPATGFVNPYGIVAGPDGNLWFTETMGSKIGKITTTGVVTEYVVPTASASTWGITSGGDGNLWFTDFGGNKVGKITTAGLITESPTLPTANSGLFAITTGPDGNLWFTETSVNKIGRISITGNANDITTAASPVAGGTVSCTPNPVNYGGSSTCTATPNAGYTFGSWSGNCTGATCVLSNVTAAKSVMANFALNTYAITATASPAAGGTASCTPNPVSHGASSTCTASANPGYSFTAWSGDCTGATCVLSNVTAVKSVTATFTLAVPVVSFNLSLLEFSEQNVGTTSAAKTVTLTNTGAATLSISSIDMTVNPNDFAVTGCAGNLAASASCNLSVTFTPTATGTRIAAMKVTGNAADSAPVNLSGIGVAANVPICTLSAAPARIAAGRSSTLTASCNMAGTTLSWTGGTCAGTTAATCVVRPTVTTPYSVTGTNGSNASNPVSATVTVKPVDLTPILMLLLD